MILTSKVGYGITNLVQAGFEYYGAVGPLTNIPTIHNQQQQLFAAVDLNLSPDWEFNCGYGWGFTPVTDNAIFKVILGYRIHKKHSS